jgi:hypothetical protein
MTLKIAIWSFDTTMYRKKICFFQKIVLWNQFRRKLWVYLEKKTGIVNFSIWHYVEQFCAISKNICFPNYHNQTSSKNRQKSKCNYNLSFRSLLSYTHVHYNVVAKRLLLSTSRHWWLLHDFIKKYIEHHIYKFF